MKTKLSSGLFNQYSCSFPFSQQFLSSETLFSCLYYPWTLNRSTFWSLHRTTIWSLWKGPNFGPYIQVTFWTFMRVQNLDLGLKVHILHEGPHRSMKDHIGTMVMFYIRSRNSYILLSYQTTSYWQELDLFIKIRVCYY